MTSTLEEAQAASDAARRAFAELEAEIKAAKDAAAKEIDSRYSGAMATARENVLYAERDLIAAKDRTPDHPWTGKKVFKIEREYERWTRRIRSETRVYGVVETRKSTTNFPSDQRHGLPRIGDGFVRLLKKDGTPGTWIDTLGGDRCEWQLVEENGQ